MSIDTIYSIAMAKGLDFAALRARAANTTAKELIAVAQLTGWTFKRTKGGHHQLTKPGRRTLTVPEDLTAGTARGIIATLEDSATEDDANASG